MAQQANVHAGVVLLGDRGVLISGRSGVGKSTLALALIDAVRAQGRFAALVADDRVLLRSCRGRVLATAPAPIAGLIELYGLGPVTLAHEPRAVVDLVVRLVDADSAPRYQEQASGDLLGIRLPHLDLTKRNAVSAAAAIMARLALPPFADRPR